MFERKMLLLKRRPRINLNHLSNLTRFTFYKEWVCVVIKNMAIWSAHKCCPVVGNLNIVVLRVATSKVKFPLRQFFGGTFDK